MSKNTTHQIAAATLFFEIPEDQSKGLQILPAGSFRAQDGRPDDCAAWITTREIAAGIIGIASNSQNRLVIDYEHQTLNAEKNGLPAPASGWFKQMEWREGEGLFATDVEWVAKAAAMIKEKEYRYLSPVFAYSKVTGEVKKILHVALTNTPALDGMQEVALKNIQSSLSLTFPDEDTMNPTLKLLLIALGLAETTSESDALTAVTALKAKADQLPAKDQEIAALKAKADQLPAKDQEIAALKDASLNAGNPDPAKFMPVAAVKPLQDQLAALSALVKGREVDEVITVALKEARLLPAQEAWARNLGAENMQSLKDYLANTTPIAALTQQQSKGKQSQAQADALGEDQVAICKALGIPQDDFKKTMVAT
ncbi:phage protease [Undibacterium danionis]|uniref:Phage protease n=1 Tax=Undibacterium danionis TaxID=1812100 RepID=A0ABV6IDW8_9BURK